MIRPLDPSVDAELELVARRMRATLEEVVGPEEGRALYTLDWLRDRVRQHLDGRCPGQVFLSEEGAEILGHTIVRQEEEPTRHGLFSTIYVDPARRGQGVATRLLDAGEAWMRERGLPEAQTCTASDNDRLIRLLEARGYAITVRADAMVRLARPL